MTMNKWFQYLAIFSLVSLLGLAMWAALPASAHMSPGGMQYPPDCCDPDGKECGPVPDHTIVEVPEGYAVQLQPGDHHLLTKPWRYTFRHGWKSIKWATDGEKHACCNTVTCFCIIVPPKGF